MEEEINKFDELAIKALEGNANANELEELRRAISDPICESRFISLKKSWNDVERLGVSIDGNRNTDFNDFILNIERRRKKTQKIHRLLVASISVAAVLLLFFLLVDTQQKNSEVVKIEPGKTMAILITSDGNNVVLDKIISDTLVEDGVLLSAKNNGIGYSQSPTDSAKFNVIQIPKGGEYSVSLSDATVVYLNSDSELKYPVSFGNGPRIVCLSGEAFFEVSKDDKREFIVKTDNAEVKVYGTSFNVNARRDNITKIVLANGSISAKGRDDEEHMLIPSQQISFDKKGSCLGITDVDVWTAMAWRHGFFAFDSETLENVMESLALWYNINVFYSDAKIKDLHFTGRMERYDSIDVILTAIKKIVGVNYTIKGNTVTIGT